VIRELAAVYIESQIKTSTWMQTATVEDRIIADESALRRRRRLRQQPLPQQLQLQQLRRLKKQKPQWLMPHSWDKHRCMWQISANFRWEKRSQSVKGLKTTLRRSILSRRYSLRYFKPAQPLCSIEAAHSRPV
jgi:hypothetical protein